MNSNRLHLVVGFVVVVVIEAVFQYSMFLSCFGCPPRGGELKRPRGKDEEEWCWWWCVLRWYLKQNDHQYQHACSPDYCWCSPLLVLVSGDSIRWVFLSSSSVNYYHRRNELLLVLLLVLVVPLMFFFVPHATIRLLSSSPCPAPDDNWCCFCTSYC